MAIIYGNDVVLHGNYVQEWRSVTWQLCTGMTCYMAIMYRNDVVLQGNYVQ